VNSAEKVRIGTSGFSYKEWIGDFYPPKTAGSKMLAYYAGHFPTVEINYTFRAMPKAQMLEGWAALTPPNFRFALKAPQRITHFARLRNTGAMLTHFAETAGVLGERLGPTLFQLPPGFKQDLPLLKDFLSELGPRLHPAFEFRDKSWFEDGTIETLRDAGAALCVAESEKINSPVERTASYVYIRMRKGDYDDRELEAWSEKIHALSLGADEIYVYLKHEVIAPKLAMRLRDLVEDRAALHA
jgi:uncharacterized protein YecE (DUF72 family)